LVLLRPFAERFALLIAGGVAEGGWFSDAEVEQLMQTGAVMPAKL
jgi:hypothetical protein